MGNKRMNWTLLISIAAVLALIILVQAYRLFSGGPSISQARLLELMKQPSAVRILDVRSTKEYKSGHIPGALHIGFREISTHLDQLRPDADNEIVVYCEMGPRARIAQRTLLKAGFSNVVHLSGDMSAWRKAGLPTETKQNR